MKKKKKKKDECWSASVAPGLHYQACIALINNEARPLVRACIGCADASHARLITLFDTTPRFFIVSYRAIHPLLKLARALDTAEAND